MNKLVKFTLATAATGGGMAAANAWIARNTPPLLDSLDGERGYFGSALGSIFFRVRGRGPAVLLVHGINAGASSFEMRRVHAGLSERFQVYTPDLLGFGQSDRPSIHYRAEMYIQLIADFAQQVVGRPVHLIASSLSGAYAVRVAGEHPDLVRRLVLILPAGLEQLGQPAGLCGAAVEEVFRSPVLGESLFNLLVSRPSLRYYGGQQAYYDGRLYTPEVAGNYYATTHQPGARFSPAAFVSGELNHDINDIYPGLSQPLFIVWGQQAGLSPVEYSRRFMQLRPGARLRIFDRCKLLPHDEHADEFNHLVGNWLVEEPEK